MKKVILTILLSFLVACAPARPPVPVGTIPKPKPLSVDEEQYGHKVLQTLTEKFEIDYEHPRRNDLVDMVDRLTAAATTSKDPWHFYLFKAPKIKNAAATRGNHIFVWSGILDFAKSDDELSTILAHEIAHVLAGHTDPDPNEEAKKLLIRIGAIAAGVAVASQTGDPNMANNVGNLTVAVADQIGRGILVNPYSRELELEADHIGLMIMAEAKYDPRAALDFWQRAKSDPDFGNTNEFFSTHPLATDRLESLKKALPQALDRYHGRRSSVPVLPQQYAQSWTDKYYGKGQKRPTPPPAESKRPPKPKDDFPDFNKEDFNRDGIQRDDFKSREEIPQFAINDPKKQRAATRQLWRVIVPKSYLYQSPNSSSSKIGEFKRGGAVEVVQDLGDWVKIQVPDEGYLPKSDLAPVYPKR